jgi:hypothetical protein
MGEKIMKVRILKILLVLFQGINQTLAGGGGTAENNDKPQT